MSKSTEFLTELQNRIQFNYLINPVNTVILSVMVDSETILHIGIILELLKNREYDKLNEYMNDEFTLSPNKNYSYSLRDKIKSQIQHEIMFIKDIENDD